VWIRQNEPPKSKRGTSIQICSSIYLIRTTQRVVITKLKIYDKQRKVTGNRVLIQVTIERVTII